MSTPLARAAMLRAMIGKEHAWRAGGALGVALGFATPIYAKALSSVQIAKHHDTGARR